MEKDRCPACRGALAPDALGGLRCEACGAAASEPMTVCPRCRHVNDPGAAACDRCSAELSAPCPGCNCINWAGAERCADCGRELDNLGHAFRPIGRSVEIRREELIRRVPGLKEQEERKSERRLDMLREADRRRMQRETERAAEAKAREQRIVRNVGMAVAVFLVIVVLAAVISLSMSAISE
jgi:hypothetical protein